MQVHSSVEAADLDALQSIGEGRRGSAKARHACSSFVETARAIARETARVNLNAAIDRAQRAPPVECGNPGCKTVQTDKKFKSCAQCRSVRYCYSACNKAHWKVHKKDCTAPATEVDAAEADKARIARGIANVCLWD